MIAHRVSVDVLRLLGEGEHRTFIVYNNFEYTFLLLHTTVYFTVLHLFHN